MEKQMQNPFIYLILLFLCFHSLQGYSQKLKGFELDGNVISTDLDGGGEFAFGLAMKGNYWLNPYVGLTMGAMINYSKIDLGFESPANDRVYYELNEPIFNLNGILGLKLSSPTYKKFGVMAGFNFMFSPIPFNLVGIDKRIYESDYRHSEEKSKSRMVYTRFNPSYNVELSVFYENKAKARYTRIAFGGGITNYNPYNSYYYAKIDNLRLKEHARLRPNDVGLMFFIRLSGGRY